VTVTDWRDRIAPHRMAADREFAERVRESDLDRQQWDLAMTAVEFEVAHPSDPEAATLVADTSNLDAVLPELARSTRRPGHPPEGDGGGLLDGIRSLVERDDAAGDRRETVERLATAYAAVLEDELREAGEWERVCRAAES